MKCAIMQPTYLPWAGFFNLIAEVDRFVFLDDAQFSKSSWHNRNRLLIQGETKWITVPVAHSGLPGLDAIAVRDTQNWRRKHINMLRAGYGRHGHFADIETLFDAIDDTALTTLADININIIAKISRHLGLADKFLRASTLAIEAPRTQRLIKICEALDCGEYLSPAGARDYLLEDGDFAASPIELAFQQYRPRPYFQKGRKGQEGQKGAEPGFVSHLSIVDVIANMGWENTAAYIKSL